MATNAIDCLDRSMTNKVPATDPVLLQVLLDIKASLQRLENHLLSNQPSPDEHEAAGVSPNVKSIGHGAGDEEIKKAHETNNQPLEGESAQRAEAKHGMGKTADSSEKVESSMSEVPGINHRVWGARTTENSGPNRNLVRNTKDQSEIEAFSKDSGSGKVVYRFLI